MKLGKAISWLMGNQQRSIFPQLEECWSIALTEKEQRLVSILDPHIPNVLHFRS